MSRHMLYILGEPGVGKTTVVRRMVKGIPSEQHQVPYVYFTVHGEETGEHVVQLGWDRDGAFGGTDSLGMAAQKHVLGWLGDAVPNYVLGEGDRLANGKFFDAVTDLGYKLVVVLFDMDEEALAERRAKRNAEVGKAQDDRWLAGRRSKVWNLHSRGYVTHVVDVTLSKPLEVCRELSGLSPVAKKLNKLRHTSS